jgi:hypothetical protein
MEEAMGEALDRSSFLLRVREAMRAGGIPPPARPLAFPPADPGRLELARRPRRAALARARATLVGRFRQEAERVGARAHGPIPDADVGGAVAQILALHRARRVVVSPRGIQVPAGLEILEGRDGALLADAGITTCDFGIAESGTLACVARRDAPRLPSILPPVHVAIVRVEDVLELPADLFLFLPADAVPSSIVLITGPSRTADIEQTMTVGVHGPGVLEIVLATAGDA